MRLPPPGRGEGGSGTNTGTPGMLLMPPAGGTPGNSGMAAAGWKAEWLPLS
jgi:hypothetical protein